MHPTELEYLAGEASPEEVARVIGATLHRLTLLETMEFWNALAGSRDPAKLLLGKVLTSHANELADKQGKWYEREEWTNGWTIEAWR